MRTIDHHARTGATSKKLPPAVVSALTVLRERLRSAIPLQISSVALSTWYLFTDGSCEAAARTGAVGAVLYDQCGRVVSAFSESVPTRVMHDLLQDSANPIYELELFPVLISFRKWASRLAGSQVVSFVDNDAAKYALVRSCSATQTGAAIVDAIRLLEQRFQLRVWYARVPTHSNPADAPSRLDVTGLEKIPRWRHLLGGVIHCSLSGVCPQAVWTSPSEIKKSGEQWTSPSEIKKSGE
ncbi:unnamed protein product [Symbiodinium sp. KB8]|nr:unnamed protein product [Symbiodinium sp. KB8]